MWVRPLSYYTCFVHTVRSKQLVYLLPLIIWLPVLVLVFTKEVAAPTTGKLFWADFQLNRWCEIIFD